MMKKFSKHIILSLVVLLGVATLFSGTGNIQKTYADDDWEDIAIINKYTDSNTYYYNKRWYVELEEVIEGFGGRYYYDERTKTATATLYGKKITVKRNATKATVAGKSVSIGAKALCLDDGYLDRDYDADDLYVPISFVKSGLKATVTTKKVNTGYGFKRTVIIINKNNRTL